MRDFITFALVALGFILFSYVFYAKTVLSLEEQAAIEAASASSFEARMKKEQAACDPYRVLRNIDVASRHDPVSPGERVFCADGMVRLTK